MIRGIILIWHNKIATIPVGWALCDGSKDTPDLRDKYPIGASLDQAGVATAMIAGVQQAEGGTEQHTHSLYEPYEYIIDSDPAGDYTADGTLEYCYPPSTAFPYIMKL